MKLKKQPSKNFNKLTLVMLVLIGVLLVAKVVVANRMSTKGKTLVMINQQINALTEENNNIKSQNAQLSSLLRVSRQADEAGFLANPSLLVLPSNKSVAQISQ